MSATSGGQTAPPLWAWIGMGALALALRAALVHGSPTAFGYVYDLYHEAVELFYQNASLPASTDCWQCYHPPLFYVMGLGFYALGMALFEDAERALRVLSALPMLCGLLVLVMTHRVMSLYRLSDWERFFGVALAVSMPCLFISSYGVEADILLTAIMSVFLVELCRVHLRAEPLSLRAALGLGLLAGLAGATKYNGLLALLLAGAIVALQWVRLAGSRAQVVRNGLVILAIAVGVGGFKYVDNLRSYGTLLFANGTARDGFAAGERRLYWDRYDFTTLEARELIATLAPDAPLGKLTNLPIYQSVWTTLYAQTWGDLSFFSEPSRHGTGLGLYPPRGIPLWVSASLLLLGLGPTLLAGLGMLTTLRRLDSLPLALAVVLTSCAYLYWCVAQPSWALKTKYLLFLLPAMIVYVMFGARWVLARMPPLRTAMLVWAGALGLSANLYLASFAIGQPEPHVAGPGAELGFDFAERGGAFVFEPEPIGAAEGSYEFVVRRAGSESAKQPGTAVIFAEQGASGGTRLVIDADGRVAFLRDTAVGRHTTASLAPLPIGEWVRLALVWNERGFALYRDGRMQGYQATGPPTRIEPLARPRPRARIGSDFGGAAPFRGSIAAFRIWSRALSQSELLRLMADFESQPAEGPTSDWRFHASEAVAVPNRASSGTLLRRAS